MELGQTIIRRIIVFCLLLVDFRRWRNQRADKQVAREERRKKKRRCWHAVWGERRDIQGEQKADKKREKMGKRSRRSAAVRWTHKQNGFFQRHRAWKIYGKERRKCTGEEAKFGVQFTTNILNRPVFHFRPSLMM
jgi:hypothetical protein